MSNISVKDDDDCLCIIKVADVVQVNSGNLIASLVLFIDSLVAICQWICRFATPNPMNTNERLKVNQWLLLMCITDEVFDLTWD